MAAEADDVAKTLDRMNAKQTTNDEDDALPSVLDKDLLHSDAFDKELEVEQSDPTSPLFSVQSFADLGLSKELLDGVYAMGFNKPSKIQERALPVILGSNGSKATNLIAQGQSGTGKTAAFTLGMLSKVDPNIRSPQALCLSSTREIAIQIHSVVSKMAQFTTIKPALVVAEGSFRAALTEQVIIGTPGKVMELITRRLIPVKYLKVLVLDEADIMIDTQGLGDTSMRIASQLPKGSQFLLFSATYSDKVAAYATSIVPKPLTTIKLPTQELSLEKIKQFYVDCLNDNNKFTVLEDIYENISVGQSIVFVHTKETAKSLQKRMTDAGHAVSVIYGGAGNKYQQQQQPGGREAIGMTGEERDRVITDFRNGVIKVLISTNVLARGLDVLQVSLVVNYDLPLDRENNPDYETYLHRIGRSGRFGRSGIAVNFVHDDTSKRKMRMIQDHFQKQIVELPMSSIDQLPDMLKKLNLPPSRP